MSRILDATPATQFLYGVREMIPGCQLRTETKCVGEVVASAELQRELKDFVSTLLNNQPFARKNNNPLRIDGPTASQNDEMWRNLLWLTFVAEKERDCTNNETMTEKYREAFERGDIGLPRVITATNLFPPQCFFCDELVEHWIGVEQMNFQMRIDWPLFSTSPSRSAPGQLVPQLLLPWPLWPTVGGHKLSRAELEGLSPYWDCLSQRQQNATMQQKYVMATAFLKSALRSLSGEQILEQIESKEKAMQFVDNLWGKKDSARQRAIASDVNDEAVWKRLLFLSGPGATFEKQNIVKNALDSILNCGANPLRDIMHGEGFRWNTHPTLPEYRGEWSFQETKVKSGLPLPALFPRILSSGKRYFDAWIVALVASLEDLKSTEIFASPAVSNLYNAVLDHYVKINDPQFDATQLESKLNVIILARENLWNELQTFAQGKLNQGNGNAESLEILHSVFDCSRSQLLVSSNKWGVAASSKRMGSSVAQGPTPLFRYPYWLPYGTKDWNSISSLTATVLIDNRFQNVNSSFLPGENVTLGLLLQNNGPNTFSGRITVTIGKNKQKYAKQISIVVSSGSTVENISFEVDLLPPLQSGQRKLVTINSALIRNDSTTSSLSATEMKNAVDITIRSTNQTVTYTAWTYASQISLFGTRLAEKLPDNTRLDPLLQRQPVESALLVPFSRTFVDISNNSALSSVSRDKWTRKENDGKENIIVLFNNQSETIVYFPLQCELEVGQYLLVAAIICDKNGIFSTMYRNGTDWFMYIQNNSLADSDASFRLDEKTFKTLFHCNAHRIVQAWYSRQRSVDNASIQKQIEIRRSMQRLLPPSNSTPESQNMHENVVIYAAKE